MKFADIITNGTIFQANKPVYLFGTGGGTLTIEFMGEKVVKEINTRTWCVKLSSHDYGGPYELKYAFDSRKGTFKDIYFGDVYTFSGQSNMQFKVPDGDLLEEDKIEVKNLRFYSSERPEFGDYYYPEDGWVNCTIDTVNKWSFLAYAAGKNLAMNTDHMIGIITCYQGAADIQSYMPNRLFEQFPEFNLKDEDRFDYTYNWNHGHSQLYEEQIIPLIPFQTKATVWYQGESNSSLKEAELYQNMLEKLIISRREDFLDDDLPYIIIQIADYIYRDQDIWKMIQDAQENVQNTLSNVTTVYSKDFGDSELIHPTHKKGLAKCISDALSKY